MKPELAEIAQLKKEVAKLRMERDLLKKLRCVQQVVETPSSLIEA
jgi:transposase-like protein